MLEQMHKLSFFSTYKRYQGIKDQINLLGTLGMGPAETFQRLYSNDHSTSSLILMGLRENGTDEATMGRWGPWRERGDGSCTRHNACGGIETRVRRRRCLSDSCVGNPFQRVVCSLGSSQSQSGEVPQNCDDASLRSLLPNPELRLHSNAVNYFCTASRFQSVGEQNPYESDLREHAAKEFLKALKALFKSFE